MPEDTYFHARKTQGTHRAALELWKGTTVLGVWQLTPEQAWQLAAELLDAAIQAPPPESERCKQIDRDDNFYRGYPQSR